MKSFLYVLLALCFAFTACQSDATPPIQDMPAPPSESREPKEAKPVPKFDRDSAYAYVEQQVNFGPRVVNSEAHAQTREWLVGKLESFGAEVREQDFVAEAFDGTELNSTNIIARFSPELQDRILLAAHWDTRPFADSELEDDPNAVVNGADDGASGVGVLLEVARQLGQNKPDIGVDIVLLDAEDYGESGGARDSWALGAQYYAKNIREPKPRFGILLDMVGARNARFAVENNSERYAPQIVRKVWRLANSMGYGDYYVNERGGAVLDDHYFINTIANIPTIDIINLPGNTEGGQFVEHWHTGDDNLDVIDKRTLRAVGQVVLATVFREAAGTL